MSKSLFIDFMEKMLTFPLWVKQTIFLNLSDDLTNYLSNEFLDVQEGELFHVYRPMLSDLGQSGLWLKLLLKITLRWKKLLKRLLFVKLQASFQTKFRTQSARLQGFLQVNTERVNTLFAQVK